MISVAAYKMNVFNFTGNELDQLDERINNILKNIIWKNIWKPICMVSIVVMKDHILDGNLGEEE